MEGCEKYFQVTGLYIKDGRVNVWCGGGLNRWHVSLCESEQTGSINEILCFCIMQYLVLFFFQFCRSDAEGFIEYVCDVNIPKNLTNRTIFYNYCINDGYQDIPEYFRDQKMHAHSVRYLQFSDKIRMAGNIY